MPPEDNPVGVEMVRRIAALARLRVPEQDLPALTGQLARIVSYIDQLKEIAQEPADPSRADATPLREDAALPGHGEEALAANGTPLLHGHGAVPRVVGAGKP